MKLYVFVAQWSYCDGAAVVTANSFEDAVARLIREYPERLDSDDLGLTDYKHAFVRKETETSGSCYRWELVAELELKNNDDVCFIRYNYAWRGRRRVAKAHWGD